MKNNKNLREYFDKYISEKEYSSGLRPKTIISYKETFDYFMSIMKEVDSVDHLTIDIFNLFFKRIKSRDRIVGKNIIKKGLAISTVKTYANKLSAFCEWLVIRNYISSNPLKSIHIPFPSYTDSKALDDQEILKILTSLNLYLNNPLIFKRDRMIIYILTYCGLRKGELLGLRVVDIDFEKSFLRVRSETSKSKKDRYLPMNPILIFYIKEYIEERNRSGYKTASLIVSSIKDEGLTSHGLKHWVKKVNKLSGVKFHLHRFRHSFACNLAKGNVNLAKIQKVMGHSDPRMTNSYLRSIEAEDCREDINKLFII